jgi:hypothetical protein
VKTIIVASLAVAILVGLCVSFASIVIGTHVSYRYDPGLSSAEMQHVSELTGAQAVAFLGGRRKPYPNKQWSIDSLGESYFWGYAAQKAAIPATGIFFACIFIGALAHCNALRPLQ